MLRKSLNDRLLGQVDIDSTSKLFAYAPVGDYFLALKNLGVDCSQSEQMIMAFCDEHNIPWDTPLYDVVGVTYQLSDEEYDTIQRTLLIEPFCAYYNKKKELIPNDRAVCDPGDSLRLAAQHAD